MTDEPDIIKQLRKEEETGKLYNNESLILEDYPVEETDKRNEKNAKKDFIKIEENSKNTQSYKTKQTKVTEGNFKKLLDCIADPIIIVDKKGKILEMNEKITKILDYKRDDFIGKNVFKTNLVNRKTKALLIKNLVKRMAGAKIDPYEIVLKANNGKKKPFEINAKKIDFMEKTADLVVFRDLSQRKKIQKKLKESEKRFRLISKATTNLIYEWDVENDVLEWFGDIEKVLGYSKGEISRDIKGWIDLIHPDDRGKLKNSVELHRTSVKPIYEEYRIRKKDGTWAYWEDRGIPILNEKDNPIKWIGGCTDITKRKQNEEALKKSEERFRQIAETTEEWIWEIDKDGLYTYASPVIEKILGYKPNEVVLKKHFYDFFHPDEKKELKKAAFDVFTKKQPIKEFINRNVHKNGKIICLSTTGVPIIDKKGKLKGYRGVDIDITEKKKSEEKIKENEKRLTEILENIPTGIMAINANTHEIIEINKQATEMIGLSKEQIIGNICHKFVCPAEKGKCPISDLNKTVDKAEKILIDKDKNEIKILKTVIPINLQNKEVLLESFVDITDIIKAREIVEKSKKYMEDILNAAADGIRIVRKDFKIIDMNKTMEKLIGLNKQEAMGMSCRECFGAKNQRCGTKNCSMVRVLKTGEGFQEEEQRVRCDGKIIDCLTVVTPYKNEKGEIIGIIEDFRDITEVKKVKKELDEKDKRFKQFFKSSPDYCYMVDLNGKILDINKAALEILGFENRDDVVGKEIIPTVYSDENKAKQLVKKWKKDGELKSEEIKIKTKKGERVVLLSVDNVLNVDGKLEYSILMQKDITDINKAQKELHEKLEQLEKYKKLTVGRELKMIELKKEIKELKIK